MAKQPINPTPSPSDASVSRRTFIQSVAAATGAAAALSGDAIAAPVAPDVVAPGGPAFKVLSDREADLLRVVLNRLVPAEGAMPAAGEVGVVAYIDDAMADAPHLRVPILDVLGQVRMSGEVDVTCAESLDAVLAGVQAANKDAFDTLLQAAYTGYYNQPEVLKAIGWIPPGDKPDAEPTFDVATLEDVIKRGPVYRNV
jgi:hypothetical protein